MTDEDLCEAAVARLDWRALLEEVIRQEVNKAIQEWREAAYLTITDYNESAPIEVEMRIPDYDDGFLADVVNPRTSLADLVREYIHLTGAFYGAGRGLADRPSDAELLAGTLPGYHPQEQRKLQFGQDLLRLVLAFEEERTQWLNETA